MICPLLILGVARLTSGAWDSIGYLGALLTTSSFIPQLLQTWRTKRARDVAWGMLIALNAGVLLWLGYGVGIHSRPIILANGATLVLTLGILILKLHYR